MFAEGYLVRINALPLDPDVSPPPTLDALYNPTRRPDDTVDLPLSEARLPILRWGFLHGDSAYDVVHVRKGRFFRLDAHFDRFFRNVRRASRQARSRRPCR
ncbi:MAG: hypothetical protein J4F40_18500 [Alphaproteobacteria bacterium]|nr:hypothetical protein [Alphaproteobacteria bacterium]MCY4496373.1 hypothetical protein [Rhodospirillaceae bacterium]